MGNINIKKQKCKNSLLIRIKTVENAWYLAAENYHIIDDFLMYINNAIQELRNITFIIQKNKFLKDDFEEWYEKKQNLMKKDKILKWLKDSRNRIVKQSDLKLFSVARLTIENWEAESIIDLEVPPLLSNKEISHFALRLVKKETIDLANKTGGLLLKIEREFIDSEYKDVEILSLISYGYISIKNIVLEFLKSIDVGTKGFDFERDERITSMDVPEKNRTIWVDIRDGSIARQKKIRINRLPENKINELISDNEQRKMKENFEKNKAGKGAFGLAKSHLEFAKSVLKKQEEGFLPMINYFNKKGDMVDVQYLAFQDRMQKYYMFNKAAQYAKSNKDIHEISITVESWSVPTEKYQKLIEGKLSDFEKEEIIMVECLNRDGKYKLLSSVLKRDDKKIDFVDLPGINKKGYPGSLFPFYKVWNIPYNKEVIC